MPAYLMVEGDENGAARLLSQELPADAGWWSSD